MKPGLNQGLAQYDATYQSLTGDLWEKHYLRRTSTKVASPGPDAAGLEVAVADSQKVPAKVLEGM